MDKKDKRQKLIVKLVCVLLSFGLWIYVGNVQSSIRSYTIKNVPVKLVNTDALRQFNLAISPDQDFTVDIKIEGDSKYIYSVTKEDFSLVADMGEYALKTGVNNIPVQVVNSPSQVNIENNDNLIVSVKLEKMITKEFNTVSNVNITYANGVYKKNENFTSEQVSVSGPESAVNRVSRVALTGTINNVSGNITKAFPLEPLDENGDVVQGVTLSKSTGTISIGVNNGKSLSVQPNITGSLPSGYKLVSATPNITSVEVLGDANTIASIQSLKTEPIDLSNITDDTEKMVKVIVPNGIKLANSNGDVTVKIDVEKESEPKPGVNQEITKNFEIPVNYTGLDSSLDITDKSQTVTFTVKGKQSDVDSLNNGNFSCAVDLSSYKEAGTFEKDADIKLANNTSVTVSNPSKIKFTLQQKSTPTDKDQNNDKSDKKTI